MPASLIASRIWPVRWSNLVSRYSGRGLPQPDSVKLLERVARARSAVLDRIEDGHTKPLNGEQHELRDALTTLDNLRRIAERQWLSVKG